MQTLFVYICDQSNDIYLDNIAAQSFVKNARALKS